MTIPPFRVANAPGPGQAATRRDEPSSFSNTLFPRSLHIGVIPHKTTV
jgi:hypothetical protein